jgi:hypothetical protein
MHRLALRNCLCPADQFSFDVVLAWSRLLVCWMAIEPLSGRPEDGGNLFLRFDLDVHIIDQKDLLKVLVYALGIRVFLFIGFGVAVQWLGRTKWSHSVSAGVAQRSRFILAFISIDKPGEGV